MRRKIIPYNPKLKFLAKQLRNSMTIAEKMLWNGLKNRQILGYDFDRQRPIDNYIVDFYCKDLMLAIEVDGASHDSCEAIDKDKIRQARLEDLGVRFLRFDDDDVKHQLDRVLRSIEEWIVDNK
ncbi:MAG: endonuclease domain-containing protein [Bacteroidales bacterium]|jgi:very-short-patch-repair endonuclease|nr:endonuclease domain-containing protein [Bacteroidales bacterium]